ncbi:hypothetical protein GCK32_021365 [Trichostrongylus colubriformis]|uniref:Uncharacterized protein n=1 Tax=Trichostrongylus colubriformis TaxID=6319 RepID=A0AAN8F2H3_TRICO
MFVNGSDQQFYQTTAQPPPPPPSQQPQQPQSQQHQSVIVRQPELPDEPDDASYAASASYYGLAPSTMVPNAYPSPYNMNMPIPFFLGDWNQLGMFTQPSPADSSCSSTLAPPLTSPIGNPAIGMLRFLQTFPFC